MKKYLRLQVGGSGLHRLSAKHLALSGPTSSKPSLQENHASRLKVVPSGVLTLPSLGDGGGPQSTTTQDKR